MKDEIVKEWFERANRDFETAKLIFEQGEYYDEMVSLLQQTVEKYLKGYLIFYGWELKKIHDIETLLTEATEFDKSFEKFLDFGRKITAFYYENRYPPGPVIDISKDEAKEILDIAEEIINKIKKTIMFKE